MVRGAEMGRRPYSSGGGGFLKRASSLARASVARSGAEPTPPPLKRPSSPARAFASRLASRVGPRNGAGLKSKNSQKFRRSLSSTSSASVSRQELLRDVS